jgi:hypothetical protein
MLGGRVLDDAVEGAGAVQPVYDGEPPRRGHCQPQPVSEWLRRIGGRKGQLAEGRDATTLQRLAVAVAD